MSDAQSDGTDWTPVEGADVCVIGAGPAGALLSHSLARRGHDVVVLEAGPRFDKAERVDRMKTQLRPGPSHDEIWDMGGERDEYSASGAHSWPLNQRRVKGVGGTSLHWGAVVPRLFEKDFEMQSRYGIGRDWPISYEDLRPYYARAEREIGVSGDEDAPYQPPREEPFPMDPFEKSRPRALFEAAGEALDITVQDMPMAINKGDYDRNACQGYGTCQFVCPSGGKYSADIHVDKAEAEGATVIDRVPVQRLEHGPDGEEITEAVYETPEGETHRQTADVFVAAAGAYETPRLLLLSDSPQYPDGLANSSGTVGKYFMGHPPAGVLGFIPGEDTLQGAFGPQVTTAIHQFYDDNPPENGCVNMFPLNTAGPSPATIAMGQDTIGDELLETVDSQYGSTVGVNMSTEMLPRERNRITLDRSKTDSYGNPVPDVQVEPGEYARNGQETGIEAASSLIEELGGNVVYAEGTMTAEHDELGPLGKGGYHPMGGTRMGTDPDESVVDPNLRTHDLENLYISSGGVFVTGGAANPTLTIMALSLKAADHIHETAL
ncbi:GMC family oxidoreductase [Haloarcula sp. S1CR25-12]|uniref:GMC family oxidoreductase n=1 Tax=Haloarcula saliterrae TaxID=2950534 RepID=A0ABU2F680_9EURY|nr:GMC family oxidoreductase [Haloarcula sp. S1CR25-12]MDS0257787.1 GMC family oxidoreductase [Haloarcula sp. S1CR25-12]